VNRRKREKRDYNITSLKDRYKHVLFQKASPGYP
jgi:hypothetical protein